MVCEFFISLICPGLLLKNTVLQRSSWKLLQPLLVRVHLLKPEAVVDIKEFVSSRGLLPFVDVAVGTW